MLRKLLLLAVTIRFQATALNVVTTCARSCPSKEVSQRPDCDVCSNFRMCVHGISFLFSCSNGLHYDSIRGVCDRPGEAQCGNDNSSVTSTVATFTPQSANCVSSCEGVSEGAYPSCQGCGHYVICLAGRTIPINCPGSRHWDNEAEECLTSSTTCSQ